MNILIVHGNTNVGASLSSDSLSRAKRAKEAIDTGKYDLVIVSGGIFEKSQYNTSIAEALQYYLKSQGVKIPIRLESKSLTTIHNVELCLEILSKDDEITVITSDYHVPRTWQIWMLLARKKVKKIQIIGSRSHITLKKVLVEIIGLDVGLFYWLGWRWPEMYFRNKARTI